MNGSEDSAKETKTLFTVTSEAFEEGERIPRIHTGEGEDLPPPLAWTGAPSKTREYALICDDPDAPSSEPWVHWVLYAIPADVTELKEGEISDAKEGTNSWGKTGYGGPMPPSGHGVHHYRFQVFALDKPVALKTGADKKALLDAMEGHVLARYTLTGTYERK